MFDACSLDKQRGLASCHEIVVHRWETAADAAIGRTLGDFLVHDMHDLRLLKDLAGRCGQLARHLTIVETNFDVPLHQMPPNRLPPQQLCSLANVLSCPGHFGSTVINRLVDYVSPPWPATDVCPFSDSA
jgi:hypothetical protein